MSTTRYGSSVGPAGVHSVGNAQNGLEEVEDKPVNPADSDKLLQCPYDKNHQIRACRFPFHILKCAKNHPKLASELKTCPYNAKHIMPKHELAHHIENCEDKGLVTLEDESNAEVHRKFRVPVTMRTNHASEEDWENEADDQAETFVWGVSTNQLAESKPEPRVTNNLTPGLRAPRTLPWKL